MIASVAAGHVASSEMRVSPPLRGHSISNGDQTESEIPARADDTFIFGEYLHTRLILTVLKLFVGPGTGPPAPDPAPEVDQSTVLNALGLEIRGLSISHAKESVDTGASSDGVFGMDLDDNVSTTATAPREDLQTRLKKAIYAIQPPLPDRPPSKTYTYELRSVEAPRDSPSWMGPIWASLGKKQTTHTPKTTSQPELGNLGSSSARPDASGSAFHTQADIAVQSQGGRDSLADGQDAGSSASGQSPSKQPSDKRVRGFKSKILYRSVDSMHSLRSVVYYAFCLR